MNIPQTMMMGSTIKKLINAPQYSAQD